MLGTNLTQETTELTELGTEFHGVPEGGSMGLLAKGSGGSFLAGLYLR